MALPKACHITSLVYVRKQSQEIRSGLRSEKRKILFAKWGNFNLPLTCERHPLCNKVLLKVLRSFVLLEEVSDLGETYQQV